MKRLIMLLVLLPLPVCAEMYSWTDAAGTAHFTDDLGAVPARYRKKAVLRDETQLPDPDAPAADRGATVAPAPHKLTVIPPAATRGGTPTSGKVLYGGKSALAWQTEFRQRRGAVQELERQIRQLKATVTSSTEVVSSAQIADLNVRRADLAQQYEAAARELNQLVERANRAGLPSEYAQ